MILDQGEAESEIMCRLIHATLSEHPRYKALSYSWDVVKVLYPIDVDGYGFGVGPNLKAALQSIRHPSEPRYLWVDAICINQKDIAERNYQVTIMHGIYHQAVQVIVWLGKKSFDSDSAMDVLEDDEIRERENLFPTVDRGAVVIYTSADMTTWKALGHFFSRTWWERVWVVQEVVWAADVIIMCGTREMSWNSLLHGSLHLQQAGATSNNITINTVLGLAHSSFVIQMAEIRRKRIDALPLSLERVLAMARIRRSTDPRDKIFGILNLLPLDEWPCSPDYSKSIVRVFSEVAKRIIEGSGNLTLLSACEHPWLPIGQEDHIRKPFKHPEVRNLPSWTPNWRAARISIPLYGGCDSISIPIKTVEDTCSRFAASGTTAAEFSFSENMTTLNVRGSIIDVVKVSTGPLVTTQIDTYGSRLYKRLERVAFDEKPMTSVYFGNMSRLEAFCRALVLDHPRYGNSLESRVLKEYSQWRKRSHDYKPELLNAHDVVQACHGRFFFCSSKEYMGFGPYGTAAGDFLCGIYGCHVPIVLRKRNAHYLAGGNVCHKHEFFRSCLLSRCSNEIKSWEEIDEHYVVIGESCKSS